MGQTSLIFLDIDGVLNCDEDVYCGRQLNPSCIERLNRLVASTPVDVILSSSWRKLFPLYEVEEMLREAGYKHRLSGMTPSLFWRRRNEGSYERGDEICLFLETFPGRGWARQIASFVVLDDSSDMRGVEHRFVQTDYRVGLRDHDIERAAEILADPFDEMELP